MSKNNTYQHLLKKYRNGSISSQDLHRLERAALDDPFLADAMDGFDQSSARSDTIEVLGQKIIKSENRHRKISLSLYAVAASFIILLAATFWIGDGLQKQRSEQMMTNVVQEKSLDKSDAIILADLETQSGDLVDEANINHSEIPDIEVVDKKESIAKNTEVETVKYKKSNAAENQNTDLDIKDPKTSIDIARIEPTGNEEEEESNKPKSEYQQSEAMMDKDMTTTYERQATPESASSRQSKDAIIFFEAKGQVTDIEFRPLPNAFIQILSTGDNLMADDYGNFTISMSEANPVVEVSYAGYITTKYELSQGISNQISLEKITIPIVRKKIDENVEYYSTYMDAVLAYPEIGATAFENRLLNVNNPDNGSVELQFRISKLGNIDQFKILSSNCGSCEFLAKELLRQAGKWRTKPPFQEVDMSLKMQFYEN